MSVRILIGDCREILGNLPDKSANCCVTSPPYFGLRDYGEKCQIGLEATPNAFVSEMVSVFREVRRVLRDDGALWLNLGDSYVATATGSAGASSRLEGGKTNQLEAAKRPRKTGFGLPVKNLIGIPWMVAFALQADGWYLRQDIIWHKPNPMPESVRDRCTKAHEYIFLLSKSERYWFDAEAIKEPAVSVRPSGNGFKRESRLSYQNADGTPKGSDEQWNGVGGLRNRRSVWTVPTKPFKGAHFATFPPDLIEPCILAGCPTSGTVLDPFGGAGTTGLVSNRLGRDAVLIEMNEIYAGIAERRMADEGGMLSDVIVERYAERQLSD